MLHYMQELLVLLALSALTKVDTFFSLNLLCYM